MAGNLDVNTCAESRLLTALAAFKLNDPTAVNAACAAMRGASVAELTGMIPLLAFLLDSGEPTLQNAAACAASRIGSAKAAPLVMALERIALQEGSQQASSAVFALGRARL